MWRLALSVASALMILGCSQSPAEKESPASAAKAGFGSIVGVAVDADGKGVEDVAVSVFRERDAAAAIASATTEANGKFTVENVPAGDDFVVHAAKKKSLLSVSGQKEHVVVRAGKTTNVGNIQLSVPTGPKAKR